MKVRAIRPGFFNHIRRREGDVFSIPDKPVRKLNAKELASGSFDAVVNKAGEVPAAFGSWMEQVGKSEPERTTTAQQALNKASDELKAGKAPAEATGDAEVI